MRPDRELIHELVIQRRLLHSLPEPGGSEENTSSHVIQWLRSCFPDKMISHLGGYGVAAVFDGRHAGQSLLFRAELDALPSVETEGYGFVGNSLRTAHLCGHDGHMAILFGVAKMLSYKRPDFGRVILLFQPAEENGQGASAVINDPKFAEILPDRVFALHNLPGFPLGRLVLSDHMFASASVGIRIVFKGIAGHASEPEKGQSPLPSLLQACKVITEISERFSLIHPGTFATITHLSMGNPTFGTQPGNATLMATLRSATEQHLLFLRCEVEQAIRSLVTQVVVTISYHDHFPATFNDPEATRLVRSIAEADGFGCHNLDIPFRWSEDFGHFTQRFQGAMFGLGVGVSAPPLHHNNYHFPDALIEKGILVINAIIAKLTGKVYNKS